MEYKFIIVCLNETKKLSFFFIILILINIKCLFIHKKNEYKLK